MCLAAFGPTFWRNSESTICPKVDPTDCGRDCGLLRTWYMCFMLISAVLSFLGCLTCWLRLKKNSYGLVKLIPVNIFLACSFSWVYGWLWNPGFSFCICRWCSRSTTGALLSTHHVHIPWAYLHLPDHCRLYSDTSGQIPSLVLSWVEPSQLFFL